MSNKDFQKFTNQYELFETKEIRKIWHNDEWFFSVVDIVGALTDSVNSTDYFKKLRRRDEELKTYIGTNYPR